MKLWIKMLKLFHLKKIESSLLLSLMTDPTKEAWTLQITFKLTVYAIKIITNQLLSKLLQFMNNLQKTQEMEN